MVKNLPADVDWGLRYDEVPPFRRVRARVIFAQHGQAGLVYIVWAQCGTPESVGELLDLGVTGDGMMKAAGGNRNPEAMLGRSFSFNLLCPAGRSE